MKFKSLRKLNLLTLAIFTQNFLVSQVLVTGTVVDGENKEPLLGAQVIIDSITGTLTDNHGFFKISLEEGEYTATITYLGFEKKNITINTREPDIGPIVLQLSNTTLEEVIVSASAKSFKEDFKGSNFRIAPATLTNRNPLSTEELLKTVPGVNIVGDMGLSNRPNISVRGSWGRRSKKVLLMEDGTPSAPAPYIAPGAYYNPVSDRITAIEVYKGADMLRYGPNNMYGAINYITALPPQKSKLRLKLIGGQRNYQTGLISYGGTWNNLGALVEGVYKKFDGFTDNSSVEVLNLNAKVFAKLSNNQSLYFKVSGQSEDNQASLSSQTPFTFETDPTQNPLDADQFTMRRYGLDIIHKWLPTDNLSFTSKAYASDFERDWWRQVTTKIRTSELQNYVGDDIFNDRYNYLNNTTFNEEDYVIVGRIDDGKESTTDSRWTYTVSGIKETMKLQYTLFEATQQLESGLNLHRETFKDRFLIAQNSRWARSGDTSTDLWYRLWSLNGYLRNEITIQNWSITPILRFEHVDMYRQNLIALAQEPYLKNIEEGREPNIYNQFLPGITLEYRMSNGDLYGSIYEGMIAPSKVFGFLVEQDGIVTNPLSGENINIEPELSWNREIGWRGELFQNRLDGQLTYFNNTSRNFYAGGRNEVFNELGKINVQGVELALGLDVLQGNEHKLRFSGNMNLMKSKVLEGKLEDKDLFSQVIHSASTEMEYINKVNNNRNAYDIYVSNGTGGETLITDQNIDSGTFQNMVKSVIKFGNQGVSDSEAPYTPLVTANFGLNYNYKRISLGVSGNLVGSQYTEFHNFDQESADGAIGKLSSYKTFDFYINYDFELGNGIDLNAFINGKNITDEIYRASRLNRATSGIFGGGFRQIIFGLNFAI